MSLTYPQEHNDLNKKMHLSVRSSDKEAGYIEFQIPEPGIYTSQIDIVRKCDCPGESDFPYLLINETKYYVEPDTIDQMPIRSLKIPSTCLKTLRLYTSIEQSDYSLYVYPLTDMDTSGKIPLNMDNQWISIIMSNGWMMVPEGIWNCLS